MSQGAIRACGERGLLVFCPACKGWEPVDAGTRRVSLGCGAGLHEHGAWCRTCGGRLPKIEPYPKPAQVGTSQYTSGRGPGD